MSNENETKIDEELDKDTLMEFIKNIPTQPQTPLDEEFDKYCKLYEERFGRHAYIAESSGTKEQTIKAIKTCLEKDEDLLDDLLFPNRKQDREKGIIY